MMDQERTGGKGHKNAEPRLSIAVNKWERYVAR